MPKFDAQNTLKVQWSKREQEIIYIYPVKKDGMVCHHYLACEHKGYVYLEKEGRWGEGYMPSFFKELEKRGYDLTTLKFSIKKKVPSDKATEST